MDCKTYFTMLLLLGVVGTAFSAVCPKPEDIFPCRCDESSKFSSTLLVCYDTSVDMSLADLKRILSVFDTQHSLSVELYYLNLGTVPTDFFQGFHIKELDFAHCTFEQIPDEEGRILVGLEDTLETLTVIDTIKKSNSPAVLDLSHLRKLRVLDFNDNTIPEISDDWFKKVPPSLTELSLINNDIQKLGMNAFANLQNLEDLSLVGNHLRELKRSMLPNPATELRHLFLRGNRLNRLPEDFFTGMPSLGLLDLDNNYLETLPQETFGKLWGREGVFHLHLADNPIDCGDSVLKWMFETKNPPHIFGECVSPIERKGRDIRDVIIENQ